MRAMTAHVRHIIIMQKTTENDGNGINLQKKYYEEKNIKNDGNDRKLQKYFCYGENNRT